VIQTVQLQALAGRVVLESVDDRGAKVVEENTGKRAATGPVRRHDSNVWISN